MNEENGMAEQDLAIIGKAEALIGQLNHWMWTPLEKGAAVPKRILRAILRMLYIVVAECRRDRLTLRASSLTFTIVLSLVPTIALGTAVLKGLGAGDQMKSAAYRFIDSLDQSSTVFPSTDPAQPSSQNTPQQQPESKNPQQGQTLTSHLKRATDTIFDYVERTNFATLGALGIAGLVLAVLSVLGNIETSMNAIWQAQSNRPLGRKMIDYLSLMILLPVTVNLTLAAEAVLQSPTLFNQIQQFIPVLWLQSLLLTMLPILIVIGTFTLLYRFLPNTTVNFLPALLGGVAGGLGWFALQSVYIKMQIGVARYNAIYGSFATLPLFLVWLYMGWLVFLLGAEVAFAVQVWRQYLPESQRLTPLKRLTIAFEAVATITEAFQQRGMASRKMLASVLSRPEGHIRDLLEDLEEAGIIHHVQEKRREGFVPAAPAETIPASEIVRMVFGSAAGEDLHHPLTIKTLDAAMMALADKKVELPERLRKKGDALPAGMIQSNLFGPKAEEQHQSAVPGKEPL